MIRKLVTIVPLLLLSSLSLDAQCSMCFRTAAAQQEQQSKALNYGIAVLLVPPLAIFGTIVLIAKRRDSE